MSGAPAGWHANTAEHTVVWTTTTRSLPSTMRDLADILDAEDGLLLLAFFVSPIEPSDPAAFIVQATLSRVRDTA